MKGKITISGEEVRGMVESHIRNHFLIGFRVTEIKLDGYRSYDPSLEVAFTNEPEEEPEEEEGAEAE